MYHFKVYNSVALDAFTMLCNLHHHLFSELFSSPQWKPHTHQAVKIHSSCPQAQICFLSLWIYLLWTFHINGIIQYVAFSVWLLSLSITFSRFIHVVACVSTSLPFMADMWKYHILYIHLLVDIWVASTFWLL